MKTPSQRRTDGAANRIKFQTQHDLDLANGVPSYQYGQESSINYRRKIGKEAAKMKVIEDKDTKKAKKLKAEADKLAEQKRLELKNRTVFDIIDIDD